MSSPLSLEGIEKIFQILQSNQNKINLLNNDLTNEGNNIKTKTIQFLNGLEIDIKNILSLLDRIKIDFQKSNQNVDDYKTYCINNDKNQFKDIIVCGCCECCKCGNGCNYSTDNCSYSQPNNISDNNKNQIDNRNMNMNEDNNNKFNDNNRYINIKTFNEDNKELPNLNEQSSSQFKNNNYTYPNLNINNDSNDYNNSNYNPLMPNIQQNLNTGISRDKNGNLNLNMPPQSLPAFNNNNRYDDDLQRQLAFIKENLFLNEDINLPIKEKIKSSAVIKSKRFHPSRSYDNVESNPSPPRKKAIIRYSNKNNNNSLDNNFNNNNMFNDNNMNNNIFNNPNKNNYNNLNNDKYYNNDNNLDFQTDMNNAFNNNKKYVPNNINLNNLKEKMEKMNKVQNFLDKLYNQSGEVVKRFKKIFGDDIEDRILNGEINDENLNEMDNILDKIIKMSIWGKEDDDNDIREKRRDKSSSYDKKNRKRKHKFVYNALEERMKLIKAVNNKQAYFKEYPRGWYSTKEYFINNGTEINNDIANKYA